MKGAGNPVTTIAKPRWKTDRKSMEDGIAKTGRTLRCDTCGAIRPEETIDMKPPRLQGPDHTLQELEDALWANEDCTLAECVACYGPGWAMQFAPTPWNGLVGPASRGDRP